MLKIIREMQVKLIRRQYFAITRIAFKKLKISVGEHLVKLKPSFVAGGNVKWCSIFGEQFWKLLGK